MPLHSYVSDELRLLVATRANLLCEYCLIHEEDTFTGCQVEHIISRKHSGATELHNLAFACVYCNRYKGSDIATLKPGSDQLVRFFNPRTDKWFDHFRHNQAIIEYLSEIGEATSRILRFNDSDRILEREELIQIGRYPVAEAIKRMQP
ncbi:MAG: HNH endonuclease [Acidobacteria bacterium]|nr:HNH endonuclease [Acidobacteriota bacterium]